MDGCAICAAPLQGFRFGAPDGARDRPRAPYQSSAGEWVQTPTTAGAAQAATTIELHAQQLQLSRCAAHRFTKRLALRRTQPQFVQLPSSHHNLGSSSWTSETWGPHRVVLFELYPRAPGTPIRRNHLATSEHRLGKNRPTYTHARAGANTIFALQPQADITIIAFQTLVLNKP